MKRRFDSLFARLLLMQAALALALVLLFTVFFYAERNVTVSRLLAERWAPVLLAELKATMPAASAPAALAPSAPALRVERRAQEPRYAIAMPAIGPRSLALRTALGERGLVVNQVRVGYGSSGPEIWLHVNDAGAAPWFGMPGDELVPNLPLRFPFALVIGLVCVVGASMLFTRRLMKPLRQLDAAIRGHRPDAGSDATVASAQAVDAKAPAELRAIASAWQDLQQRLRRHEAERALLLAGVSHDLRSPLARIRMAADLLPAEAAQRRDSIVRNVHVADQLIESFLDHVRAGELPLDQRCDLAALLRRVAARSERPAAELEVQAPQALWHEATHTLLLERLVANLLENALHHGGLPVRLALFDEAAAVAIEVSDAGPGVAGEQWDQLIQAFARGDTSRGAPGVGLGLSIAVRIVQRHGGTLSAERRGGRFVVRASLPKTPTQRPSAN